MNRGRLPRTTISVWCEGYRDASFVRYLYSLYHVPEREVKVRVAHGGDPVGQIRQMINFFATHDYDERYALYDLDRGERSVNEARRLASANGIVCLESDQCLEMELVRLMTTDIKILRSVCRSSVEAKKIFAKMCHLKHADDEVEWERWMSKTLLESRRSTSQWLSDVIEALNR